jgi:uncharacterized protein DUF6152
MLEVSDMKSVLFGVCVGLLVLAGSVRAHHGDAGRYIEDVVTLQGTVVELQMTNPHAHIILDVTEGGKTTRWQAELGGPQQLIRNFGWTPQTVKTGTKIEITGRRLKSGAPYMNLTERARVLLIDTGKEIWKTPNYGEKTPPPSEGGTSGGPPPAAAR